jgi:hypothetical protein
MAGAKDVGRLVEHYASDLEQHAASPRPSRVRPFSRNQAPMPAQEGIGCDDRGDLTQSGATQPMGPRGQAPSVDVRELEPTPAELAPEESVFPRSDRRSPRAPGVPGSRSAPEAPCEARRGRSRGRAYITGRPKRLRPSSGTERPRVAVLCSRRRCSSRPADSLDPRTGKGWQAEEFTRRVLLRGTRYDVPTFRVSATQGSLASGDVRASIVSADHRGACGSYRGTGFA